MLSTWLGQGYLYQAIFHKLAPKSRHQCSHRMSSLYLLKGGIHKACFRAEYIVNIFQTGYTE